VLDIKNEFSVLGKKRSRIKHDLVGQKFSRLTVIKRLENDSRNAVRWECQCECGNKTITRTHNLMSGKAESCGCKNADELEVIRYKHGMNRAKIYKQWSSMKDRCLNPNSQMYKHYGGRGIKLCEEWIDFIPYYNWAIQAGYREGLSIDRIDNDGNYEPSNCRWVTQKEQSLNNRRNVRITYKGETLTRTEWCEKYGLKYSALRSRQKRGITNPEEILFGKLNKESNNA